MKKLAVGTMFALLLALGVAASVHADTEMRLGTIGGTISADTAKAGDTIKIRMEWANRNTYNYNPSVAFRIFSRESMTTGGYGSGTATWVSTVPGRVPYYTLSAARPRVGPQVDTLGGFPKLEFGGLFIFNCFGCDGSGVDTIAFAAAANDPAQTAIPPMDSGLGFTLVVVTQLADTGKVICIDSSTNFPPTNSWKWAPFNAFPIPPNEFPIWAGIKCWYLKNPGGSAVGEEAESSLPTKFDLYQNYPNPFNPTTKIKFDVPRKAHVKLTIYNVLGQAVNTLVNEEVLPGEKFVEWHGDSQNGSKVSSGMYFYKLEADGFLSTKKMLLVK